ncbi:MAG: sodium-translocating pyrophosphatase [Alphaproteobacteria bacterium]|nr:sodium-translocating pyrophosphatase [Alphaproteobacteria bacterium]
MRFIALFLLGLFSTTSQAFASEADLILPNFNIQMTNGSLTGNCIFEIGLVVCILGIAFGLLEFKKIKNMKLHSSMENTSILIHNTCNTYLIQQIKLLAKLEVLIGLALFYYFWYLRGFAFSRVIVIFLWSLLGIAGSVCVAAFGITINNWANCRTAFESLKGKPAPVLAIPLRSGMSIGVVLICVELVMMLSILLFVSPENAGSCFIGFAIGESLGASVLRICGGIFTKIADIGADLMKIFFKIGEDDARNPGVTADCTGDNAGDSVGPTADGFETYGVTGVALITFIILAVGKIANDAGIVSIEGSSDIQARLIVWIFAMRIVMVITSVFAYLINGKIANAFMKEKFNFELPLTTLVWLSSILAIAMTFGISYALLSSMGCVWLRLATIISCGTLAAALIPELTKAFTSSNSKHVHEVVNAGREGGASLSILSGIVAGNFSAFWKGMTLTLLMLIAYIASAKGLDHFMIYPTIFAFGLVAFGMLSMGPVTIAVDSYGPVTDNAQSVFELSQIEQIPGIKEEIKRDFGFDPDFEKGKYFLEENDSAGNTFKATAKPVLIGTAVMGATTMIFSIILMLNLQLSLLDPRVLIGFMAGGALIYWFCGASIQAVTTGAYRAVQFIKDNIHLDSTATRASTEDSTKVVRICTVYAQYGMINIFGALFCFTLAYACFDPTFFASYLISIAIFGLYQAIFMANAGGAWDNAKKLVEVDMHEKNTDLHAATVVGDTVGDPFKDTSSVALNPIIKFTTLFGLLAVEIAVEAGQTAWYIGGAFFLFGLYFIVRSFYGMRIPVIEDNK